MFFAIFIDVSLMNSDNEGGFSLLNERKNVSRCIRFEFFAWELRFVIRF